MIKTKCIRCGKIFSNKDKGYQKKTCDIKCAKSTRLGKFGKKYNTKHHYSTVKQCEECNKNTVVSSYNRYKVLCNDCKYEIRNCIICDKEFKINKRRKRLTCGSQHCWKILGNLGRSQTNNYGYLTSKGGYREDLGHSCRSEMEAIMCRIFIKNNIAYEFEKYSFKVMIRNEIRTITPDFLLFGNLFYDTKGHAKSKDEWTCSCERCLKSREKTNAFINQYPHIHFELIGQKEFKELLNNSSNLLNCWNRLRDQHPKEECLFEGVDFNGLKIVDIGQSAAKPAREGSETKEETPILNG